MGVNGSVTTAGRSFSGATCRDTAASNQPGLDVPVLFCVFNRLPEVERVFEAIRQARPSRLYLAGDGPRPERRGEVLKCEAVRRHVTGKIDWPCEVRTFFKDSNAGPRIAIGEAITWFFENEEMGIVLEEDCLPGPEFFPYCEELLEKYRDDERVMHISGTCQLPDLDREDSYFFSRYPRTWGWATWKRAWSGYSLEIDDLESDLRQIKHHFTAPDERNYWERILRRYDAGKIETWDHPWALTIWKRDGLSLYPPLIWSRTSASPPTPSTPSPGRTTGDGPIPRSGSSAGSGIRRKYEPMTNSTAGCSWSATEGPPHRLSPSGLPVELQGALSRPDRPYGPTSPLSRRRRARLR